MTNLILCFAVGFSTLAAIFALLAFRAARRQRGDSGDLAEQTAQLIRTESNRIRSDSAEQARRVRRELADNLGGFQAATLQVCAELGRQLGKKVHESGGRLDAGIRAIEGRMRAIGTELDQGMERISQQATRERDTLEQTITGRLDDSAAKDATASRELREEVSRTVASLQEALVTHLSTLRGDTAEQAQLLRTEVTSRLNQSSDGTNTSLGQMSVAQREQLTALQTAITENVHRLTDSLSERLDDSAAKDATASRELGEEVSRTVASLQEALVAHLSTLRGDTAEQAQLLRTEVTGTLNQSTEAMNTSHGQMSAAQREQLTALQTAITENVHRLTDSLSETFTQLAHQRARLEDLARAHASLTEGQLKAQEALRDTLERRLDAIRTEDANKVDEMRRMVDEKLQSILDDRRNESFPILSEQLERIHQGLGEMQSLATDVGDLQRVLSSVKVPGTGGEVQLGNLLERFLAPEHYLRDAQVRDDSPERVEFAIRLPARDGEHEVLLPIDASFPQEDFARLATAATKADAAGVEVAAAVLELRIKARARLVDEKYINPPRTTDVALLFLPSESLYAEVLRRPGLFEYVQRECHVTITGPTTLGAFLNALQMGFRSLAIGQRSSEVWQMLGATRAEFGKFRVR